MTLPELSLFYIYRNNPEIVDLGEEYRAIYGNYEIGFGYEKKPTAEEFINIVKTAIANGRPQ